MAVDFFDDGPTVNPKKVRKGSNTPILDNFSRDLIKLAEEGKIDPVVGRDKEVKRIAQILSRKKKNNAVIVGKVKNFEEYLNTDEIEFLANHSEGWLNKYKDAWNLIEDK
jgi:hypothetical protein